MDCACPDSLVQCTLAAPTRGWLIGISGPASRTQINDEALNQSLSQRATTDLSQNCLRTNTAHLATATGTGSSAYRNGVWLQPRLRVHRRPFGYTRRVGSYPPAPPFLWRATTPVMWATPSCCLRLHGFPRVGRRFPRGSPRAPDCDSAAGTLDGVSRDTVCDR